MTAKLCLDCPPGVSHKKSSRWIKTFLGWGKVKVRKWNNSVLSNSLRPHELLQARILEWVPFASPGDLPNPGIKPRSPALQAASLPAEPPGGETHVARWASQVVLAVKNLPANAGDNERFGFDPWVRKIPWRRAWQPTPVFLPGGSSRTEPPGGLTAHGVATNTFIFRVQGTAHALTPPPGRLPVCAELFLSSFLESSHHLDWGRGRVLFIISLHREGNRGWGGA